jgi:hypothetical protein
MSELKQLQIANLGTVFAPVDGLRFGSRQGGGLIAASPGAPGEGWGEGDFEHTTSPMSQGTFSVFGGLLSIEITLTPASSPTAFA